MAQELTTLSDAHEFPMHRASAMMLHGWALSRSGEIVEGISRQEQGLATMAKTGMQTHRTFFLSLLAESLLVARRYSDGLHKIDEAIKIAEQGGEQSYLSRLYQLRGELRLQAYGQGVTSTPLRRCLCQNARMPDALLHGEWSDGEPFYAKSRWQSLRKSRADTSHRP